MKKIVFMQTTQFNAAASMRSGSDVIRTGGYLIPLGSILNLNIDILLVKLLERSPVNSESERI